MAKNGIDSRKGATLIELMVAVAIVGILAAIGIPILTDYVKESRLSEATTNIQGILEAEQGYFLRLQRYTGPLILCPTSLPAAKGMSQLWDNCNDAGWIELGWSPEGAIFFQYQVFSLYDAAGTRANLPTNVLTNPSTWGVDWAAELGNNLDTIQPWCAVQAIADTDGDAKTVFFRGNSYNQKIYRSPNPDTEEATY